jgi:hypothetical protein
VMARQRQVRSQEVLPMYTGVSGHLYGGSGALEDSYPGRRGHRRPRIVPLIFSRSLSDF